jgi:hypothetical protein
MVAGFPVVERRLHASWLRQQTLRTTGERDARAAHSKDSVCCRHPRVQSELDPCACSPEARRHPAAALIARDEWLHPCGDREAHPPSGSTPARAGRHSAGGNCSQDGVTISPVLLRRKSLLSRRYSSPRRLAATDSGDLPVALSCASRPSRTLIVVAKDERTEPFSASQFHPPS